MTSNVSLHVVVDVNMSDMTSNSNTTVNVDYTLPWWQQFIFYVFFVAMFVVAFGGNVIVIWIVLAHKRMRTVTNYFLVNLAVADVLISLFNTPFNFLLNLYQDWWFGRVFCKFTLFIAPCAVSASVLTLMAIAIDRYIAIIHPLRPRLTGRIVVSIIVAVWAASVLLALPNLIVAETHVFPTGRTICYMHWPDMENTLESQQDLIYSTVLMVLNYFLPMATLACTYARISWELWISKTIGEAVPMQAERIRSKRKVVKMMVAVVVIFGLCWLPYQTYFIVIQLYKDIRFLSYIQQIYLAIYWLAMSNSMYNPIIYCLMNARFRQGFLQVFRFCPCGPCRKLQRMACHERGFYSTRVSTNHPDKAGDRNGSLMHTTMESIDDTNSTPSTSMYRMHPINAKPHHHDSYDD